MTERLKERLNQLKFISSMFNMAMVEFNNVMGPETIQTIFRLIGERQGEVVEQRWREGDGITNWTPELLAKKISTDLIDVAVGEGSSDITVNGNEMKVVIKDCPFKQAGIKIGDKFYCTYTEGLIDTISKKALGNTEFKSLKLRSVDNCDCEFTIKT